MKIQNASAPLHRNPALFGTATALLLTLLFVFAAGAVWAEETYDGLMPVPESTVAYAAVDPNADFSGYDKIMILDCYVAFQKDWQRNQKRTGSHVNVSSDQMAKITGEIAELFNDVFSEVLAEDGTYEIVNEAGEGVLLVRPAIIDLDIKAPDTAVGRSRTYTTESGAATLYIELYDSVTGDILARAADRKGARSMGGFLTYTTQVTNRADARRALSAWANLLKDALDELRG